MAIQLAQNQDTPVSVSYLVPEEVDEQQKKEAKEKCVALFGVKPRPGQELSDCFDEFAEQIGHVDTVVGYGIEFGTQARRIQSKQKSKRIHVVPVSHENYERCHWVEEGAEQIEERQDIEENLCSGSAILAVAIGTHLKRDYRYKVDVTIVEYTPSIFGEFSSGGRPEKAAEGSFQILMFYPSSSNVSVTKFTDEVAKLFPGRRFHLTVAGIPDQTKEKLKSDFGRHENTRQDKPTLRGPCKSLKKLHQWFCQADVLVVLFGSSHAEDFGIYALQAISATLPVLVSCDLGIADTLKGLEYGSSCVVNPDTPDQWQERIMQLAEKKPDLRSKEGQSLREYYQKAYPWSQRFQQVAEEI